VSAAIHNEDAERALLAVLLTGAQAIDDVADMLQGRDFYQPRNEAVYDACLRVAQRGDRVDPVTLPVPAKARQYVMELVADNPHAMPTAALQYAGEVLDAALRRRVVEASDGLRHLATNAEDAAAMASDAERLVAEAVSQANTTEGGTTVGAGLDAAIDWLANPPIGADTPWVDVNHKTNGLLAGQMITVAARPGHGKSLVAKEVALFTAMQGRPVHIATLEMSRNEYLTRMFCGLGRVDLGRALRRQLDDNEWTRIGQAAEKVRELPLYLDDRESQTMAQVRAGARHTARRFGDLGLIAIDYAQLVRPADRRLPREQQVAEISRQTKLMAKEFGCPVMLLAQLNRGNTQRSDHTPMVSDLRESGALEQDSDQVWLLHRPDQYPDGEGRMGEVDLIVGKNRNGPAPSVVSLAFVGHYAQVASLA
jgi:replicative DNA helicase